LISVITPFFKIISPGAVVVSGASSRVEMGKISLAGPIINIFFSAVLIGFALGSRFFLPAFYPLLLLAAFLNGFMAVFNLIPIGILDGFKIYSWDKKLWGMVFALSVALSIVTYVFLN
jgi:Zn-dependent protease